MASERAPFELVAIEARAGLNVAADRRSGALRAIASHVRVCKMIPRDPKAAPFIENATNVPVGLRNMLCTALALLLIGANTTSRGACSLTYIWAWRYPQQTSTEIRSPDGYQLVTVSVYGRLVQVRYGDAQVADLFPRFAFSVDPFSRLVRRSRVYHWYTETDRALATIGCLPAHAPHRWHAISSYQGYTWLQGSARACNYQALAVPSGEIKYWIVTRAGARTFATRHNYGYPWSQRLPALLFARKCRG